MVGSDAVWRAAGLALAVGLTAAPAMAEMAPAGAPAAFGIQGRAVILSVRGIGAQIYECKPDPSGGDHWVFREPVAALVKDGTTVGRHYAGPTWALDGDATVTGKLAASAPGVGPDDITLLKLDVVQARGEGALKGAALVLRLNTQGGALKGACEHPGELRAAPYSADYVFLR